MVTKLLTILLIFSFVFTQEPCEGTCLSEDEAINLANSLKSLEHRDSTNTITISNLNDQIKLYMEQHANDSLLISLNKHKSVLLNDKIKLYDELVKQVKPKWYENKWLWFTLGAITTAGTLKLASDIVD